MPFASSETESRVFFAVVIILQIVVCLSIALDIAFVRQVVGFLYFAFVPGMILIRLLKLDALGVSETIVFSLGLSLAFLMMVGLLANTLGPIFGIFEPLSLIPLMVLLNIFIICGVLASFLRKGSFRFFQEKSFRLPWPTVFLTGVPVLSIIGAYVANSSGSNLVLLLTLIIVAFLFTIIGALSGKVSSRLYPIAILIFAISLLFHASLISNYIFPFGSDVPLEYSAFRLTQNNSYWAVQNPYPGDAGYGRIYSMLSVTILPTVLSNLLNINATWIFKIIFPLIFSFVTLGLYQLWKKYVSERLAFFSAFFFMSYGTFFGEMLGLGREMIAELFLILLLLVIFGEKMKKNGRIFCFTIFSFALVTSHYGLSEIFLFFVLITFVLLFVFRRRSKRIGAEIVLFFLVVMFAWYIFTSNSAAFNSLVEYGNYVYNQLGDLFNLSSRGQTVLRGLGLESPPTIWNAISRGFAYATEFLIVVGFIGLVIKRTKVNFDREYSVFNFIAMAFLVSLVLVPGLADTMNMTRFYQVLLIFLAPLCIIGGKVLVGLISKNLDVLAPVLLIAVLIPYFLFQTSVVYEVTKNDSYSVPLSKYRINPIRLYGQFGYIDAYSAFGAQWLSKNGQIPRFSLHADTASKHSVLSIYGMIYRGYVDDLLNTTTLSKGDYVYLDTLNVKYGWIASGPSWNLTELSFTFDEPSKLYTNGNCEIYRN